MSEKKYLSDGRKVVVIGSINKTEHIVQEVFVTADGSEIPSGENFTAKTLLDEPAQSWKERAAENLEKQLEELKREGKDLKKQIGELKAQRLGHSTLLQSNEKFLELFEGTDTSLMADIVTGNVEYVMFSAEGYDPFRVQTFEEAVYRYERGYYDDSRSFDSLRMLSVMCAKGSSYPSDRRFYTTISDYYDGSGGEREIVLFKDLDSVKEELTKRMYDKLEKIKSDNTVHNSLSLDTIEELEKWIDVPAEIKLESEQEAKKLAKKRYEDAVKLAAENYLKTTGEKLQ